MRRAVNGSEPLAVRLRGRRSQCPDARRSRSPARLTHGYLCLLVPITPAVGGTERLFPKSYLLPSLTITPRFAGARYGDLW